MSVCICAAHSWDDPSIVALNPSLASKLPHERIRLVVRSPGSGTSQVFVTALAKLSGDFAASLAAVDGRVADVWLCHCPVGQAKYLSIVPSTRAMIETVLHNKWSVGYSALSHVLDAAVPTPRLKNKRGTALPPSHGCPLSPKFPPYLARYAGVSGL